MNVCRTNNLYVISETSIVTPMAVMNFRPGGTENENIAKVKNVTMGK